MSRLETIYQLRRFGIPFGHHCRQTASREARCERAFSAATSARAAINTAFSALRSSGREERSMSTNHMESQNRPFEAPALAFLSRFSPIRPPSDAMSLVACANPCRITDRKAAPSRSLPFCQPSRAIETASLQSLREQAQPLAVAPKAADQRAPTAAETKRWPECGCA
jgi:hypothetical protein